MPTKKPDPPQERAPRTPKTRSTYEDHAAFGEKLRKDNISRTFKRASGNEDFTVTEMEAQIRKLQKDLSDLEWMVNQTPYITNEKDAIKHVKNIIEQTGILLATISTLETVKVINANEQQEKLFSDGLTKINNALHATMKPSIKNLTETIMTGERVGNLWKEAQVLMKHIDRAIDAASSPNQQTRIVLSNLHIQGFIKQCNAIIENAESLALLSKTATFDQNKKIAWIKKHIEPYIQKLNGLLPPDILVAPLAVATPPTVQIPSHSGSTISVSAAEISNPSSPSSAQSPTESQIFMESGASSPNSESASPPASPEPLARRPKRSAADILFAVDPEKKAAIERQVAEAEKAQREAAAKVLHAFEKDKQSSTSLPNKTVSSDENKPSTPKHG